MRPGRGQPRCERLGPEQDLVDRLPREAILLGEEALDQGVLVGSGRGHDRRALELRRGHASRKIAGGRDFGYCCGHGRRGDLLYVEDPPPQLAALADAVADLLPAIQKDGIALKISGFEISSMTT